MANQRKAYTYGLMAIMFWSTIATAFSLALKELSVFELMTWASFTSVVCLYLILVLQKKQSIFRRTSAIQWRNSALMGLLNPFLYYAVLLEAYAILPAQEALVLNYIWPVTLVLLSIPLLKQKIGIKSILSILLSFSGVIVIVLKGSLSSFSLTNWYGDLLALSSSIAWAFFWIFNIRDQRDESEKLFLNFLFGFIYSLTALLIIEDFTIPGVKGLMAAVYIGLFELGITFVLWLKALKYSGSTDKVSQLVYLSPFVSLFFIRLIVGESILPSTIAGLVLIIAGILIQQRIKGIKTQI
jgi:drug/metabolite transporter (DMT)-like permease